MFEEMRVQIAKSLILFLAVNEWTSPWSMIELLYNKKLFTSVSYYVTENLNVWNISLLNIFYGMFYGGDSRGGHFWLLLYFILLIKCTEPNFILSSLFNLKVSRFILSHVLLYLNTILFHWTVRVAQWED
jgi:hypothetical protein